MPPTTEVWRDNMKFGDAYQGVLTWAGPAAIGLAVSLMLCTSAHAGDTRKAKEETRTVTLFKYRVNNAVYYNKKNVGKVRRVTLSQYLRSNPYVCTPSGFGQKSRCYARGFKQPSV